MPQAKKSKKGNSAKSKTIAVKAQEEKCSCKKCNWWVWALIILVLLILGIILLK
ncbi:MAG: hypothetical protein ACOYT4_04965 [Nanoarchaeota archaeon]